MRGASTESVAGKARMEQRLGEFIEARTGVRSRLQLWRRFTGGFSWSTYGATITQDTPTGKVQDVVVRIGEPTGLLAPYSTAPESQVLRSLHGGAVPVPAVLFASDDTEVVGAPFMVQERVRGVVRTPWEQARGAESGDNTIAAQFVDTLAALHRFDWTQKELPALDHATTEGNAALRQLARWQAMLEANELRRLPLLHYALHWLRENAPVAPAVTLVHGDYRSGNFLEDEGRITAILDWELVHLGDPHEDLGWACMRMFLDGDKRVCGLMPRDALYDRYAAAAGRTVNRESVRYYEALSLFKVIAMNMSGARRIESGRSPDLRMTSLAFGLPQLMRDLLDVMERAR
ncbi:phosphotransferase family protein [Caenimonas aquaedulcis]|uniref:Phosphotransferase family protein n=1 Tax=Caenimonas aquaedulcis TaxID=2793270 RepID=A0A931MGP7_9BURK|nr:phosphotransferase family protein [Caenimonas aquaedulcis]MBG9388024.1 phosphotransferase family protein [Caenimonas aquaedulcis]